MIMKTTIKLTTEQIDQLVETEAKELRKEVDLAIEKLEIEFNKRLSNLRKKYENYSIDVSGENVQKRGKFNEELFISLYNAGKGINEIAREMGIASGYAHIKKGQLVKDKKIKNRKK